MGLASIQFCFYCLPPPPPHASFLLHFWWSTKFAADVSPTQWKHSLMCLCASRLWSYGKRKHWREIMNFWIGLISFCAFQKYWNKKENNFRPIHLSHTTSYRKWLIKSFCAFKKSVNKSSFAVSQNSQYSYSILENYIILLKLYFFFKIRVIHCYILGRLEYLCITLYKGYRLHPII